MTAGAGTVRVEGTGGWEPEEKAGNGSRQLEEWWERHPR